MGERLCAEVEKGLYEDVDGEGVVSRLGYFVSFGERVLYVLQDVKDVVSCTLRLDRRAQSVRVEHPRQFYTHNNVHYIHIKCHKVIWLDTCVTVLVIVESAMAVEWVLINFYKK